MQAAYGTPHMSSMPSYMSEYANPYMQVNRTPMPQQQQHQYPSPSIRPPHTANTSSPLINTSNYYYPNNVSPHLPPPHIISNKPPITPNAFSNLIEVPQYSNSNVVDCIRRQKNAIAVQKGNVLEIVPNAEVHCDRKADTTSNEPTKGDKVPLTEKQQQQHALQRQKNERIKRKMEREMRRRNREKRKRFLIDEIKRLSRETILENGLMVRAGDLLQSAVFDGKCMKVEAEIVDADDYVEPEKHSYNPEADIGKSILSERNSLASKALSTTSAATKYVEPNLFD